MRPFHAGQSAERPRADPPWLGLSPSRQRGSVTGVSETSGPQPVPDEEDERLDGPDDDDVFESSLEQPPPG